MKVIILAAGYGTRLYPLTLNTPKALLDVGGKTILERVLIDALSIDICDSACIVSNHKFYQSFCDWVERHTDNGLYLGKKVHVVDDMTTSNETRLGAIGDIHFAVDKLGMDDDLLVLGSDNLFGFDLRYFIDFAVSKSPSASLALYDVKDLKNASLYGIAIIDDAKKEIIDFQEKPENPKSTLAATAIYYYPRIKIASLNEYMKSGLVKDAPGNFVKWLNTKEKVYGYVFTEKWYDIGDIASLEKANEEFRQKEK